MSQPTGVCKSVRYISLCGALHSVLAGAFSSEAEGVCKSVRYISLLVCNTVAVAALYPKFAHHSKNASLQTARALFN